MAYDFNADDEDGLYLYSDTREEIENQLDTSDVDLACFDKPLKVGEETDLAGIFNKKLKYCGILKYRDNDYMLFYLGSEPGDLFTGEKYYYDMEIRIKRNILCDCFKFGTMRNFVWINNEWR
jgi:hypothetical protein